MWLGKRDSFLNCGCESFVLLEFGVNKMNFVFFGNNLFNSVKFKFCIFLGGLFFSFSVFSQVKSGDFSVNDCLIASLKGVNSDAAAKMVKAACEAKDREHKNSKAIAVAAEYGDEISSSGVSYVGWDYKGDKLIVAVKNELPREGPSLSYIRLSIGVSKAGEEACSIFKHPAYKVLAAPDETILLEHSLFFPKTTKELCVSIDYARAKVFSWKERLSYKASLGNPKQLPTDPFDGRSFPPEKINGDFDQKFYDYLLKNSQKK